MRTPVLDGEAAARQGAALAALATSAERPLHNMPAPDPLVDTVVARLERLADPLREGLGVDTVASVEPTRHPPRATCIAFDLATDAPLGTLYLDRACVDRVVAVQCGMARPTARTGCRLTPFETGLATAFVRTLMRAVAREADDWRLSLRDDAEPDVDAAGDATVTLRAFERGMTGDVVARARVQLFAGGSAAMRSGPPMAAAPPAGLSGTPVRLRAVMAVPKQPLATIRGLRVGQTLRLGANTTVEVQAGRRRFATGVLSPGEGQRHIELRTFADRARTP